MLAARSPSNGGFSIDARCTLEAAETIDVTL